MKLRIYNSDKTYKQHFQLTSDMEYSDGAEAIVFYKEPYIYKVVHGGSPYVKFIKRMNDLGYLNHTKYLPKIYQIVKCRGNKFVFKMEFLKHFDEIYPTSSKEYIKIRKKTLDMVDYVDSYRYFQLKNRYNDKPNKKYKYTKKLLNKIILEADSFVQKHGDVWDLHHHNIMIRGKNTLVITDPLI